MGEQRSSSPRPIVFAIVISALLIAVGLAVGLAIGLRQDDNDSVVSGCTNGGGSPTTAAYKSATGIYDYTAVVADSSVCSEVGTDIVARKRGNAIDAAVAATFCTGLLNAHSAGIGGGSFIIIYDSEKNEWHAINSRETAPGAASENMYAGEGGLDKSLNGGMASGVPGEVMGLWKVHQRLGKLPWADVVRPSTKLCEDGVPLTRATHKAVSRLTTDKMKQDFAYYFDENNNVKPIGSLIKMPKLAKTFQTIQDDPASFYNGSLAQDIVADINEEGGIMSVSDFESYTLKWTAPTMLSMPGGYKMYSIPAPGSGPVLAYILNILAGYNMSPSSIADEESKILTYHRIVEAFKFAYGKRTEMGDEDFVDISQLVKNMTMLAFGEATRVLIDDARTQDTPYYHPSAAITSDDGTTHISVLDGQGNAVSVTSTINTYFGSKVKGSRTGIVFNNEMNDFSVPNTTNYFDLPASPANFIRPGKRPMSSMSPAIVWDSNQNKVRMVTGGSGGSKITTATAMNIIDVLWLGRPLAESVDNRRMHHQLIPPYVQLENGFPKDIEEGLRAKGHEVGEPRGISVLQAIDVTEDGIVGTADFRKGGEPRGF